MARSNQSARAAVRLLPQQVLERFCSEKYFPPMPDDAPPKLTWTSPTVRLRVLFSAFLIAFFCYGFFTWVLWPVKVLGDSMMPNYHNGERYFINKLAYRVAKPQRGDVVAVYGSSGDVLLKRIVGLPGEIITFPDGDIAINGRKLVEPYVETKVPPRRRPEGKLGPQEYFVIGDNRATTVLAPVPEKDIIGKVLF
jgi:signal peptidase I